MPAPKDNAKQTGDTHPPEVEEARRPAADDTELESTPGRGENQAGFLRDRDGTGAGREDDKA